MYFVRFVKCKLCDAFTTRLLRHLRLDIVILLKILIEVIKYTIEVLAIQT